MPKASIRVVDEGWRHNRLNKSTIGQGRLLPGMLFLALAGQLLKTLCLDPARRREPFLAGAAGTTQVGFVILPHARGVLPQSRKGFKRVAREESNYLGVGLMNAFCSRHAGGAAGLF
jgi:hypothetical protein